MDLLQPLAHITSKLTVDGVDYEVEHFNIKFRQSSDFKGQPQHEVKGGQVIIELTRVADDVLYEWAKNSVRRKDCVVVFENEYQGTVLRIQLFETYCIKLMCTVDVYKGAQTTLVFAPERVVVNDVLHTNYWEE